MAIRMFFLPVDAEVLHERIILDGEQNGWLSAEIGVLVPEVGRNDEEVAGAPVEDAAGDDASPRSFEYIVHGGARLPMRKRLDPRPEHLNAARESRIYRLRSSRIDILHHYVVVRVSFTRSREALQRGFSILPAIVDETSPARGAGGLRHRPKADGAVALFCDAGPAHLELFFLRRFVTDFLIDRL